VGAAKPNTGVERVDAYLSKVPEPARSTLNQLRAVIRSLVPAEATEEISYGMPVFKYKRPLIGYAAFAEHCSVFPMSATVLTTLKDELKSYRRAIGVSKGAIQFPLDKAVPAGLVKKLVKARLAEIEQK
jgi:uncharacterized protein YdhG (YjbR/CyaY superfamily)